MRISIPCCLIVALCAGPTSAQLNPVKNPCAGNGGVDICAAARRTAEALEANLPREIAPGIRVQSAAQGGPQVQLDLVVAADLRLPDAAGFTSFACGEPPLCALVNRGGQVAYVLNGKTLATVTSCEEVN
jgi:hypothetical protein